MKKIEAIIRPEKLAEVKEALERVGYPGLTIREVEGHGHQKGLSQQWRGQLYKVELLPKIEINMVVSNEEVEKIIQVICEHAKTGAVGDGKIFIWDVNQTIRIRTGERGEEAIQMADVRYQMAEGEFCGVVVRESAVRSKNGRS